MNRPESILRADSPAASARAGRIGVLIVNLGTPDATDAGSVRRYLREFLSDARVIENQGLVWKFVLNGIILPRRPKVKGRDSIVGTITFDDHGQNTVPAITKYVVQDGKWVLWEESEYASGKRKLRGL